MTVAPDFDPHREYRVRRQMKRGKPTGLWYVQFYKPSPYPGPYTLWSVGPAKGGFTSKAEAEAWVLALRRLS